MVMGMAAMTSDEIAADGRQMADDTKPTSECAADGATRGAPQTRGSGATRRRSGRRRTARLPRSRARAAAAGRADPGSGRQDDDRRLGRRRGGAKPRRPPPAKPAAAARDADDTSPLLTRRAWMGLAWGAFSAASAAALAATGRFMFPNVLNEPPQQFKAGFPNEYGMGVDERWKEKFGVWLVRTPDDIDRARERLLRADQSPARTWAARRTGCRPRASSSAPATAAASGTTGINFGAGAAPARARARRARRRRPDPRRQGRKFQHELGQWTDPEAFLKA